jgi:hypothetical protein
MAATQQHRRLKSLLIRMEALSRKAVTLLAKKSCLQKDTETNND